MEESSITIYTKSYAQTTPPRATKHPAKGAQLPTYPIIQVPRRWLRNEPSNWGTGLPNTHNKIPNTRVAELSPTCVDCPTKGLWHTRPKVPGPLLYAGKSNRY
ncbi:unnamed protein product [Prunus armeniaca]